MQHLVQELDKMSKKLAAVSRDHENEAIRRIECENRIKAVESELSLRTEVHNKVLTLIL